jgi:LacI family transcriptional regulator
VILGLDVPLLLTWLRALGRAAPRDVAVVSLDRRSTDRGIAGVRQDYARLGASAVDLLVGLTQRNERGLPATASTLLTEGVWHDGRTLSARRSVSSAP